MDEIADEAAGGMADGTADEALIAAGRAPVHCASAGAPNGSVQKIAATRMAVIRRVLPIEN